MPTATATALADHAAPAPTTARRERIFSLDVIRGVAVMGIFSVNVVAFAMIESAYFNPAAYGGHHGASLALWAANIMLIDGKMRTLFSMLFGASTLLVIEQAEAAAENGDRVHVRRMLVLLLIGLLHYYLIWFGDILVLYALCGLLAFKLRRFPNRVLAIVAAVLLALHMALFGALAMQQYRLDLAAHAPGAGKAAIKAWNDGFGSFYPGAAALARDKAHFLASWPDLVAWRLSHWGKLIGDNVPFIVDTVGLMLIGMALFRSGYLTGALPDRSYRRAAAVLIPIGLLASAAIALYDWSSHFYSVGMMTAFVVLGTPFITAQAIGYAALIILLARRHGPLAQRIAAAGRAAFTNYLGTSLIATFVFYGWGLGLYGRAERWQAWLLAPLVWTLMLLWSKPWLERFRYGPFEWLWRSLARGRPQPFRRAA